MCSLLSIVMHHLDGETVRVAVTGELDMSNRDLLDAVILGAVVKEPVRTIVVDFRAVAFLDAAGVCTLLHARQCAAEHGIELCVDEPRGLLAGVLRVTGTLGVLTGRHTRTATRPAVTVSRRRTGRRDAVAYLPRQASCG